MPLRSAVGVMLGAWCQEIRFSQRHGKHVDVDWLMSICHITSIVSKFRYSNITTKLEGSVPRGLLFVSERKEPCQTHPSTTANTIT